MKRQKLHFTTISGRQLPCGTISINPDSYMEALL